MRRFLFVLQFDSFIKTLLPVIHALGNEHQIDIYLLQLWKKKSWIDENIRKLMGDLEYTSGGFRDLFKRLENDYDVIILGSVGARLNVRVSSYITRQGLSSRLASGYVGALLQNKPESFLKGVMRRAFTHLIWTPGSESRLRVLNTGMINPAKTRVLATGLPRFDALYQASQNFTSKKEIILFIEQPTFPASRAERFDLVQKLVAVAREYPDRSVVIKPRFLKLTGHAHRPKFLLPELLDHVPDRPANMEISETTLDREFQRTDFALSISSTGALEALLLGIPTYFIRDYCGKNNRYGSLDFEAMGNVISFETVLAHRLPEINFDIVKTYLRFDGQNTRRLTQALAKLADDGSPGPSLERQLCIAFKYPEAGWYEPLRQRFKHTHERHAELIAAWINQKVHYTLLSSSADLILDMPAKQRRKQETEPRFPRGEQVMFHAFMVGDQLLDVYPQVYSEDRAMAAWRIDQLDQLKQGTRLALEWAEQGDDLRTDKNLMDQNDQTWAEYSFSIRNGSAVDIVKKAFASRPALELSQELFDQLRDQREAMTTLLSPIFTILDEVAWYDRFFDALAALKDEVIHVPSY